MGAYIPPGWPAGVHPPGSEDFESTAVGWLLDVVPPDYRLHGVLRRYPVALATMARYHSKACVEGARQGYRTARTELAGALPPHAIDTVLAAYRKEGARLAATAEAVDLVERALRGEVFTPTMSLPAAAPGPRGAEPRGAEPRGTEPQGAQQHNAEQDSAEQDSPEQDSPEQHSPEQDSAEQHSAESESAAPRGTGPQAAEQKSARTKADQKAATQRTAKARAAEERPPEVKAAGAKAAGTKAAGARRNSAGRGRSDLART